MLVNKFATFIAHSPTLDVVLIHGPQFQREGFAPRSNVEQFEENRKETRANQSKVAELGAKSYFYTKRLNRVMVSAMNMMSDSRYILHQQISQTPASKPIGMRVLSILIYGK